MPSSNKKKGAGDVAPSTSSVKMLAGACTHPECLVKANAMAMIEGDGVVSSLRDSGEPPVITECTFKECEAGNQMHSECFARLEKIVTAALCAHASNRSTGFADWGVDERRKAMFTTKYDIVRPLCRCACGKGYLRPRLNGRANIVRVGDDPALGGTVSGLSAADLEKKKMHEAKLTLRAKQEEEAKKKERERQAKEREAA